MNHLLCEHCCQPLHEQHHKRRPILYCIRDDSYVNPEDAELRLGIFWSSLSIRCLEITLGCLDPMSEQQLRRVFGNQGAFSTQYCWSPQDHLDWVQQYDNLHANIMFHDMFAFDSRIYATECSHILLINKQNVRAIELNHNANADVALTVMYGPNGEMNIGTMSMLPTRFLAEDLVKPDQEMTDEERYACIDENMYTELARIADEGVWPSNAKLVGSTPGRLSHLLVFLHRYHREHRMLIIIMACRRYRRLWLPNELWEMIYDS